MSKKWYVSKGYVFTKNNDMFFVKAEDLHPGTGIKINTICDYCGKEVELAYKDYIKNTKNNTVKYSCVDCASKKRVEYNSDKEFYYNKFCDLCKEKGYTPISSLSDYKNAYSRLKYICPKHGEQETAYAYMSVGHGCQLCGRETTTEKLVKSKSDVVKIIENKNNNKLLNIDDYVNARTNNLRVICGSCGKEFITSLSSIMNSDGACQKCGIKKVQVITNYPVKRSKKE